MTSAPSHLELYLRHRRALIDYAMPIVQSRAQAEDIVQEAWLRFSGAGSIARMDNPLAYLYRIVRNLSLDYSRHQQVEGVQSDSEVILDSLAAKGSQPDTTLQNIDAIDQVQRALAQLPERTQRAFLLHRLHGLKFKEIAADLGVSTTLAHQLVHTALIHCMQQIDHD